MKIKKILFSFGILACATSGYTQHITATELEMDKSIFFSKIAWVKGNKSCIVFDKEFSGDKFPHFVFLFDSAGKKLKNFVKVKTNHSSQSSYMLSLGTTLFFFNHRKDDFGEHQFWISDIIRENGRYLDTTIEVFNIRNPSENKKLNSQSHSFKVIKGTASKSALITYNNDYKEPYKEGFRYRIIDESGKLTQEDTLSLPYTDRECNIDDIIYDDESSKIYLLCDLLKITLHNNREYKNSFVSVYDLKSHSYNEVSEGIPNFYQNSLQHVVNENLIAFTGLLVNENDSAGWMNSILLLDKKSFTVNRSRTFILNKEDVKDFFSSKNKISSRLLHPVKYPFIKDSSIYSAWTYSLNLDAFETEERQINVPGTAAGMIVGLATGFFFIATDNARYPFNSDKTLWFDYSLEKNDLKTNYMSNMLLSSKYKTRIPATFVTGSSAMQIMNSQLHGGKKKSAINIFNWEDNAKTNDTTYSVPLAKVYVNVILTGSGYFANGKNYFIGMYDPECDLSSPKLFPDIKYFLVEIN
jgi:hypothetical protein